MSNPAGDLLGFAGLYSWWPDPTKDIGDPNCWTLTAMTITSDFVKALAGIHDRNPVILPEDSGCTESIPPSPATRLSSTKPSALAS